MNDLSPEIGGGPIAWPISVPRVHTFAMASVTEQERQSAIYKLELARRAREHVQTAICGDRDRMARWMER